MRRLHAIRHVAFEDLGVIAEIARGLGYAPCYHRAPALAASGFPWLTPEPVVLLGGPIGVGDSEAHPCVAESINGLRPRLAAGLPTLGICLGAQLMAAALDAPVRDSGAQHIGWWPLQLVDGGGALEPVGGQAVLHWHGDTFALPKGARALATTEATPCQAFDLPGKPVLALQFHLEVPAAAIEDWLIGHHGQLQREGIDTRALRAETQRCAPAAECAARKVFGDWLRAAS